MKGTFFRGRWHRWVVAPIGEDAAARQGICKYEWTSSRGAEKVFYHLGGKIVESSSPNLHKAGLPTLPTQRRLTPSPFRGVATFLFEVALINNL